MVNNGKTNVVQSAVRLNYYSTCSGPDSLEVELGSETLLSPDRPLNNIIALRLSPSFRTAFSFTKIIQGRRTDRGTKWQA